MLYTDGTEEFYDLNSDPHEWNNLALKLSIEQQDAKNRLAAMIPKTFATSVVKTDNRFKKTAKKLNMEIKKTRILEKLK